MSLGTWLAKRRLKKSEKAVNKGLLKREVVIDGNEINISYVDPEESDRFWDSEHYKNSNIYFGDFATPVSVGLRDIEELEDLDEDEIEELEESDFEERLELISSERHGLGIGQSWLEQLTSKNLEEKIMWAVYAGSAAAVCGIGAIIAVIQYAG